MAPKPQGYCRFCGNSGLTHEHIWNQWLDDLLPTTAGRVESWFIGPPDEFDRAESYSAVKKQGGVHTKSARKYCADCNNGWMALIGEAAKPIATRLIKGDPTLLTLAHQTKLATWLSLTAMVADLQTRMNTRFPDSDRQYMFDHRATPLHWYVLLGYYGGSAISPIAFDYSVSTFRQDDATSALIVAAHSVAVTMGHMFSLVIVHAPPLPLTERLPIALHQEYLSPIHPELAPLVGIGPAPPRQINGELRVDGGLARDLSTRYVKHFSATGREYIKRRTPPIQ